MPLSRGCRGAVAAPAPYQDPDCHGLRPRNDVGHCDGSDFCRNDSMVSGQRHCEEGASPTWQSGFLKIKETRRVSTEIPHSSLLIPHSCQENRHLSVADFIWAISAASAGGRA